MYGFYLGFGLFDPGRPVGSQSWLKTGGRQLYDGLQQPLVVVVAAPLFTYNALTLLSEGPDADREQHYAKRKDHGGISKMRWSPGQ
jgi:hypothetical protein